MKIVYTHSAGIARGCGRFSERLYSTQQVVFTILKERPGYKKGAQQLADGITPGATATKALANWIGQNLFKNGFARAVVSGDVNTGGFFLQIIDRVRRATMGQKNNPSASDVAMLERLFMQAVENKQGPRDGDVEFAIVALDDGNLYVKATRRIIQGETKAEQRREITDFFNVLLEGNPSVDIPTIEGGILTITKSETARKARDDHKQVGGKALPMTDIEFGVKLRAEAHIDELAEIAETKSGKSDTKKHTFAKDGFTYRRAYFADFDGKYYEITLSIGKNGTAATVYNVGKMKEGILPSAKIIAVVGSKPLGKTPSTTNVSQDPGNVNTQYALLPEEAFTGDARVESAAVRADMESAPAEATSLEEGGSEGVGDVAPYNVTVDEAALEQAAQITVRGRVKAQGDYAGAIKGGTDFGAVLDDIAAQVGEQTLLNRMYNATQLIRPTGRVTVDGRTVDADAYMDAYAESLPDDPAALKQEIRRLESLQAEEVIRQQEEGTLEELSSTRLKLNLQLFAAQRKWDLLQLDPGEDGKKIRKFYEHWLKGDNDEMHSEELAEMLAGRNETYNPVCNQKTLDRANSKLRNARYQQKLLQRIGRMNPNDRFSAVDVAAATVLIKDAYNEGDLGVMMDLISGLSRKGTEAGRAVQAFSMMARMTPEGVLKAANRTLKAEADYVIGEGANDGLDVLADDIAGALNRLARLKGSDNPSDASGTTSPYTGEARPYGDAIEEPLTPEKILEIQQVTAGKRTSFYNLTDEQVKKLEPLENRLYRELKEKSPFVRRRFGEWRIRDKTPVQIATKEGSARGVQKNKDTGWDIQVSGKVFNETTHHRNASARAGVAYLPYINDIIENAVLLDTQTLSGKKSDNSLIYHVFYAVADIGEGPNLIKLQVEEIYNPTKMSATRRAYKLMNIENQSAGAKGSQQNATSPVTLPTGITTIADLIQIVKEKDTSYRPKSPERVMAEGLAATEGTYMTRGRIERELKRVIENATDVPEQVKRYVLKKIRKGDGSLAQRLYEMHQKGHLTADGAGASGTSPPTTALQKKRYHRPN